MAQAHTSVEAPVEPLWTDWSQNLATTAVAKRVVARLNAGFATVLGGVHMLAAVSPMADVDCPVVSAEARLNDEGETLAEAVSSAYGVECDPDKAVVLLDPRQLPYYFNHNGIDDEAAFWDSVLHYIACALVGAAAAPLQLSVEAAALAVVASALPVDEETRDMIRCDSLSIFATRYLGRDVEIEELTEMDFQRLDHVQWGAGTMLRSLVMGFVQPPQFHPRERSLSTISAEIYQIHAEGLLGMMDAAGCA